LVQTHLAGNYREEWDFAGLANAARAIFPVPGDVAKHWEKMRADGIENELIENAHRAYEEKESATGADKMRMLERLVMLSAVDKLWVRHLTALDELRTGIGLRAVAQQDPLVTFKREAYGMFSNLNALIMQDIVHTIYHAQLQVSRPQQPRPMREVRERDQQARKAQPIRGGPKIGRNDPCPCGSGRKFKNCHMGRENELAGVLAGARARRNS
jgi:preprotein translocase subunit SecA